MTKASQSTTASFTPDPAWGTEEQKETHVIKKVSNALYKDSDRPYWEIITMRGTGFIIDAEERNIPDGYTFAEGDLITLYIHRASIIHGCVHNPVDKDKPEAVLWYQTQEEAMEEHRKMVDRMQAERQAEFDLNVHNYDERFDKLPECFQKRIELRRERNENFRVDFEPYELFTCEMAVLIASEFETEAEVAAFAKQYNYEVKNEELKQMLKDCSGNQFGCACLLARAYKNDPDYVPMLPGAMAPLVGSKDYGDPIDLTEQFAKDKEAANA